MAVAGSPPTKRNVRGEVKREELRHAAYLRFRDHGYHATSVDDICEAANTSKGSFYWHYQSKQEVFIDILETWTREVMDQLYEQFEEAVIGANYPVTIAEALAREVRRGRVIGPLWVEFLARRATSPRSKTRCPSSTAARAPPSRPSCDQPWIRPAADPSWRRRPPPSSAPTWACWCRT